MLNSKFSLAIESLKLLDAYTIALYVNIIRGKVLIKNLSADEINMCRTILQYISDISTKCTTGDSCKCPVGFCQLQIAERKKILAEAIVNADYLPLCVYSIS